MPQGRNGAFTIAQLSDIHCGGPDFVPNLMERAISGDQRPRPGHRRLLGRPDHLRLQARVREAKGYLDQIECESFVVIPGNHDSRNVGYVHFEEMFGERNSVLGAGA